MEIAKVSLEVLTQRVNAILGTTYGSNYLSQVRLGKAGSAALRKVVREETAAMLQEAAEAAKVG